MLTERTPRRLKAMTSTAVAATLAADHRLIIPVGTVLPRPSDPRLPLGAATLVVEHLADDLSAEYGVLRAPTVEYGVNPPEPTDDPTSAGAVSLRKKTLHRMLNDMLATWECHGVNEFVLLTAHAFDPHQEALATVATVTARVRVVDVFAVNLSDLVGCRRSDDDRSEAYLALLCYLDPAVVGVAPDAEQDPAREHGRALYERIRSRVSERIFLAPVPAE